jgi:ABC-type transporter MlaC component
MVEKKVFVKMSDLLNPQTPSVHEYMWEHYPKISNFKIKDVSDKGVWVVWERVDNAPTTTKRRWRKQLVQED